MASKYVYFFGEGKAEGSAEMRELLGGKGANLAEMINIGIPVPPGFTISTEACTHYMNTNGAHPDGLADQVVEQLKRVEAGFDGSFGDREKPLLFSVRSGARVSMPGMMDTVLNLGLNDATVEGLIAETDNPRFAYDSYRRFIHMYGNVVMGAPHERFEELIEARREKAGVEHDHQLSVDDLTALIEDYKGAVQEATGKQFPEDAMEQLWGAVNAVFDSWNGNRAQVYRRINGIPDDWGTAVNVQAMVFGNMGDDSATGVAFTRDPSTGENIFFGEYLINAQGEDVVAGIRTPLPVRKDAGGDESLEAKMPEAYAELVDTYLKLEKHYRDMQDIEFTIQRGKLWLLQTRNGKRTGRAAIKIAVDMTNESLIDKATAVTRVAPDQLEQLLHPMIDPNVDTTPFAKGLPASPGAASGAVVFSVNEALKAVADGKRVILVRLETSPEDVEGMKAAEAILTARGGMTSHAAVVARGMGKCCVVGCTALQVNYADREFTVDGTTYKSGDLLTIDGTEGTVYSGELPTVDPVLDDDFHTFMGWVDEHRVLKVRANADTPEDATNAVEFGAEGIGLARTEHMFFGEDRIPVVREMIMAKSEEDRIAALMKIAPMQRDDFVGVLKAMDGRPVTIRLLDPPLHEFLPHTPEDVKRTADLLGRSVADLEAVITSLHEFNPMMGHRGCRLGITFPEIYDTQARAIVEAAVEVANQGIEVNPEIMIPLVGMQTELAFLRDRVAAIRDEVLSDAGKDINVLIGTMIEIPRATVVADQIAGVADFFSFGTNDLTQMTYGFSRDDSGKFLEAYVDGGILPGDPFESLDQDGVGVLMQMAVDKGRQANPGIKLGICGEHGGDPRSVEFCARLGLDYVSCSPFRIPVARLAAAQAAVSAKGS